MIHFLTGFDHQNHINISNLKKSKMLGVEVPKMFGVGVEVPKI